MSSSRRLEDYDFCALVEEIKRTYPHGVVPLLITWKNDPIIKVLIDIAGFRRVLVDHNINGSQNSSKAYLVYGDISDDQVREITEEWQFIGISVSPKRRAANI